MKMRELYKLLTPLHRIIKLIVTRAVVKLINPTKKWQELQVVAFEGEVLDGIEHVEPYGLTSHPIKDAEAILLSAGGRRAHTLAIMVGDRRYRLTSLTEGQVALYDANGSKVLMKNDNTIEITASGGVKVIGDLDVDGKITASGDVVSTGGDIIDKIRKLNDLVTELKAHLHTDSVGGSTTTPTTPIT